MFSILPSLLVPRCGSGHVARVHGDGLNEPGIANENEDHEKVVENQNGGSRSGSRLYEKVGCRIDEVVDGNQFGDHICAVSDEGGKDER